MKNTKKMIIFSSFFFFLLGNIFAGGGKHHIGIFLGSTANLEHEVSDFSLGLDYEYRFIENFGVAALGDLVFSEQKEYLLMGGVFIHLSHSVKFLVAAGSTFAEHKIEHLHYQPPVEPLGSNHINEEGTEWQSHLVVRVGASYNFHIDNFSISPTINYDIIEDNASLVYGLTLGFGF